jgi:peptide methionine sulfoxide reductase MsrB
VNCIQIRNRVFIHVLCAIRLYSGRLFSIFVCKKDRVFSSKHKYESGTGWPSFYQPANEHNVATDADTKYGITRTEVHCANVCIIKTNYHLLFVICLIIF